MKNLNIFANYQKPEDNVTHGFLSLLQCVYEKTAILIIEKLVPKIRMNSGLIFDIQSPSYSNIKIFQGTQRGFILGISSIGTEIIDDVSDKKESRADGWICDGKNLLLVESKVLDKFSGDQLSRHRHNLNKYCSTIEGEMSITWQKIDDVLKFLLSNNDIESVERKLITQYRRYLQMEGLTLDFEKFYNANMFDIEKYWLGDDPRVTLRLLKQRMSEEVHNIQISKEQVHEDKFNHYWVRLFEINSNSILWRGTLYINPDFIAVDVMAFKPRKMKIEQIIDKIMKITDAVNKSNDNNKDRDRVWIYVSNYGKRRNVQQGRNYEYCSLNYNLAKGPSYFKEKKNLIHFSKNANPKQIGVRYTISNPGSRSKSYWTKSGNNVNHEDAQLIQNPEKVVEKFAKFIKNALKVLN